MDNNDDQNNEFSKAVQALLTELGQIHLSSEAGNILGKAIEEKYGPKSFLNSQGKNQGEKGNALIKAMSESDIEFSDKAMEGFKELFFSKARSPGKEQDCVGR